jgi:DNA-binding FrmR family transcriptional regulator
MFIHFVGGVKGALAVRCPLGTRDSGLETRGLDFQQIETAYAFRSSRPVLSKKILGMCCRGEGPDACISATRAVFRSRHSKHSDTEPLHSMDEPTEQRVVSNVRAPQAGVVTGSVSAVAPTRRGGTMLDEIEQQSLVTRLNRIEGQIRGIRRMVQEPRVCVDILQQLAAAEAALNRISLAVLRHHVEKCVPDGIVQGEPEKTKRLAELVDIFDRFAK